MSTHELWWLAGQTQHEKSSITIIEVGCAWGRTTRALADNTYLGDIYAIDTWLGSPNELQTNHKEFQDKNGDAAYLEFCDNLWDHIYGCLVTPLRMDSLNAADLLKKKGVQADFVFIDACHDEAAVDQDIRAYLPLVNEGGILAGHDYGVPNWPGVKAAVDKIFPKIELPQPHIWMVRK